MISLTANEGRALLMLFIMSASRGVSEPRQRKWEPWWNVRFHLLRTWEWHHGRVGKQDSDLPKGNSWACLVQIQTTSRQTCWMKREHNAERSPFFLLFCLGIFGCWQFGKASALFTLGAAIFESQLRGNEEYPFFWVGNLTLGGQPSELSARSVRKPSWITDSLVSATPALVDRFTKYSFIFRLYFRRLLSDSSSNVTRSSSTFNIQYSNTSRFKQVFKSGLFSKLNQENFTNYIKLFAWQRRVNGKLNGRGLPWIRIPSPEQAAGIDSGIEM